MEYFTDALLLLCAKTTILLSKTYLLNKCLTAAYRQIKSEQPEAIASSHTRQLWSLVIAILFCSAFDDFTWIFKLTRKIIFPDFPPHPVLWLLRIDWALHALNYFALGLLIEKLINKSFSFKARHYLSIIFCTITICYLTAIACLQYYTIDSAKRSVEFIIYQAITFYVFFALLPALFIALKYAYTAQLPRILRHQSKILVLCLLAPQLVFSTISALPFIISTIEIDGYFFIGLSDLLFVFALYFCARKMLGLRFLNIHSHVQSFERYNFINDFKIVLEQLGYVTTVQELQHITKAFFDRAFTIDVENVQLYIRNLEVHREKTASNTSPDGFVTLPAVEQFLASKSMPDEALEYLSTNKILIRDEIEFDYFYGENAVQKEMIRLLETIDASIFLPLYENQTLVAYIIVRKHARPHRLFSNIERDEMLAFTSYLNTVIYLLRHRNLKILAQQERELREELYFKHQEIHHYKESIRTLLKTHTTQKIGILYYKNRSIAWGNQAARELLNQASQHLGQVQKLAMEVKKYGCDRQVAISDMYGNPLICSATAGADKSQVLILLFYPDIADTFTIPFATLKDLSSWDYAVYLETTKSGQLINQLIPSSTEALLNFKINLLKIAFSKGPTLIELPDGDTMPVVHIIHHISLRSMLHVIELTDLEEQINNNIALQLFGIEQVLGVVARQEGLLEKLSDTGTICIQNVEFLSRATQDQLFAFLTSGMFQPLKSDRKMISNARIICSTSNNLELLVQQGSFSADLLNKLKQSSVSLPSLLTIPQNELTELAQRLSEQAIKTKELNQLISLNEKETSKIIDQRPTSLREFKERIQHALINKTAKKKLEHLVEFNPAYLTTADPELADALRLGKHALKDRYIMRLLWNKFQNQTKIAAFLNVNRSSVNRRCKEFKLIHEQGQ